MCIKAILACWAEGKEVYGQNMYMSTSWRPPEPSASWILISLLYPVVSFLSNILGWHWLTKLYQFQVHDSRTHHLYTVLYVHRLKTRLSVYYHLSRLYLPPSPSNPLPAWQSPPYFHDIFSIGLRYQSLKVQSGGDLNNHTLWYSPCFLTLGSFTSSYCVYPEVDLIFSITRSPKQLLN